ncbi:MAG: peptidase MA family metallohydrolase [Candidatus Neomarinimicrobiota bacterium]
MEPHPSDSVITTGSVASSLGNFTLHFPADYPVEVETYLRELTVDVTLALVSRFGPVEPAPFQLMIVDSRAQLEKWVGGKLPTWIHAVAREHPPMVVVLGPATEVAEPISHRFEQILLHELTHVYLYRLYPSRNGERLPGWFHEGLAVHVSGGLDRGLHQALVRGRLTGRFYTLDQLDRIYHTSSVLSELAYAQSVVAVQTMEDFYGQGVFRSLFDEIRGGLPFPAAFAQIGGEPLEEFQARYQAALRRRYNILLVLADPGVLFILLPLLLLTAYLIKLWRNRAIAARWAAEDIGGGDRPGNLAPPDDNHQVNGWE